MRFYRSLGYKPSIFHLSADATATRQELQLRSDDIVVGLAVSDDELHLANLVMGDRLSKLVGMIEQHGFATQLYVVLLTPLDPSLPSFVLAGTCSFCCCHARSLCCE
jgi:hypothetical protein